MAIVPDQSPTSAPAEADFGANDWLLEEMYEQYTVDPSSVDQTWAEYFKAHGAPTTDAGNGAASEAPQPQPRQVPEPRADSGDSADSAEPKVTAAPAARSSASPTRDSAAGPTGTTSYANG